MSAHCKRVRPCVVDDADADAALAVRARASGLRSVPERDEASMSVDHECPDCGERYNEPKSASANHVCDPELLKERIENLSEQLSDQRFLCREHGLGVAADEDGCCVTCGQDCAHVAVLVDFPDPSCVDCGCDSRRGWRALRRVRSASRRGVRRGVSGRRWRGWTPAMPMTQCTAHDFFFGGFSSPCFTSWRYYAILATVCVVAVALARLRGPRT